MKSLVLRLAFQRVGIAQPAQRGGQRASSAGASAFTRIAAQNGGEQALTSNSHQQHDHEQPEADRDEGTRPARSTA